MRRPDGGLLLIDHDASLLIKNQDGGLLTEYRIVVFSMKTRSRSSHGRPGCGALIENQMVVFSRRPEKCLAIKDRIVVLP